MPRSNRRREDPDPLDLGRALGGWKRLETKRDGGWHVQPQSASAAVKSYVCPGCGGAIEEGVAHLVAWRADGILGDADDLRHRRHWHARCWAARP